MEPSKRIAVRGIVKSVQTETPVQRSAYPKDDIEEITRETFWEALVSFVKCLFTRKRRKDGKKEEKERSN